MCNIISPSFFLFLKYIYIQIKIFAMLAYIKYSFQPMKKHSYVLCVVAAALGCSTILRTKHTYTHKPKWNRKEYHQWWCLVYTLKNSNSSFFYPWRIHIIYGEGDSTCACVRSFEQEGYFIFSYQFYYYILLTVSLSWQYGFLKSFCWYYIKCYLLLFCVSKS